MFAQHRKRTLGSGLVRRLVLAILEPLGETGLAPKRSLLRTAATLKTACSETEHAVLVRVEYDPVLDWRVSRMQASSTRFMGTSTARGRRRMRRPAAPASEALCSTSRIGTGISRPCHSQKSRETCDHLNMRAVLPVLALITSYSARTCEP